MCRRWALGIHLKANRVPAWRSLGATALVAIHAYIHFIYITICTSEHVRAFNVILTTCPTSVVHLVAAIQHPEKNTKQEKCSFIHCFRQDENICKQLALTLK